MQKPTPQLKVLSISESLTFLLLIHLKMSRTFILLKLKLIQSLLGITLIELFIKPPPVILAHPFISFFSIAFIIS